MDGVVSVELFLVSLSRPVKMQTEWFSIAKRHCVLIERKVWEVVLSMISSEVVWCDAVGEVACVFITVLSSSIVCHHYQHVALCLVRGHYSQGHLDLLKRISRVGVGNSGAQCILSTVSSKCLENCREDIEDETANKKDRNSYDRAVGWVFSVLYCLLLTQLCH